MTVAIIHKEKSKSSNSFNQKLKLFQTRLIISEISGANTKQIASFNIFSGIGLLTKILRLKSSYYWWLTSIKSAPSVRLSVQKFQNEKPCSI